jgi:membrane-bound lytic murein transglycosylase D
LRKKKLKLVLVGFILLFSGYILIKNITYGIYFVPELERKHQRFIRKLPADLTFAGEEVHFKNKEAYRHFYRELLYRTRNNAHTRQSLRNAGIWFPVIEEILKQYGLPEDLKYMALAESNLTNARSPAGAVGFWQFTKSSGLQIGLVINDDIDERLDPVKSTHAACRYLKRLYNYFGSWSAAAAAYNVGETALYFAFRNQQVNSYYDLKLNRETASYVFRIIALKDLIENTKKYGMKYNRYKMAPTRTVAVKKDIASLELYAQNQGVSYSKLKELNPWLISHKLDLPDSSSTLYIRLPK